MKFGKHLRQLRASRGLSLKKLAKQVDVDHAYLSRVEAGLVSPSEQLIENLSRSLNCDRADLMLSAGRIPPDWQKVLTAAPELRERISDSVEEFKANGNHHTATTHTEYKTVPHSESIKDGEIKLFKGDVSACYSAWPSPVAIISDGPYGVSSFPGDLKSADGLAEWYEPHIVEWSRRSTPQTTLWFWNTEVGWATVHPILLKHGWQYRACNIWDKGIAHAAGNSNTKSLRKLPIVSEVCAQYVREAEFQIDGKRAQMKEWLRHEWVRSGLPLTKTNEACGVLDAATRKYFTQGHLWYFPPADAFSRLADYANMHGNQAGRPYFSLNGKRPLTRDEWAKMRSKFYCPIGITNVWQSPAVRGQERVKEGSKAVHINQKPLKLVQMTIEATTDEKDVVWEPFGGLCSAAVASMNLNRRCFSAEINPAFYSEAVKRLRALERQPLLPVSISDRNRLAPPELVA